METKEKNTAINSITLPAYNFSINAPEFKKEGEEFTIWFFEGILKENPNYIDCLMYLGNAYTALGMYEKGLSIDQRLSRLKPDDPYVFYNLACSYSLLNMIDKALDSLERAITLGYNDIYHLEMDKDLTNIRYHARYKKLVERMKKTLRYSNT